MEGGNRSDASEVPCVLKGIQDGGEYVAKKARVDNSACDEAKTGEIIVIDDRVNSKGKGPTTRDEEPEKTFRFWADAARDRLVEDMEELFDDMKKELKTTGDSDAVCEKMQQKVITKIEHHMEQLWLKLQFDYDMYGEMWAK